MIFQSTTHAKAPPRPGYIRASVPISSIIIIPQRPEKSGRGNPQVRVLARFSLSRVAFLVPLCACLRADRVPARL